MQERSARFGRVPVPILVALLVLLPIGPVGWFWGRADAKPRPRPASTLAQIATRSGCRLDEFHGGMHTNPPVTRIETQSTRAWARNHCPTPPGTDSASALGSVLWIMAWPDLT